MPELPQDEMALGIPIPLQHVAPHGARLHFGLRNAHFGPSSIVSPPSSVGILYRTVFRAHLQREVGLGVHIVKPEAHRRELSGVKRFASRAEGHHQIAHVGEQAFAGKVRK